MKRKPKKGEKLLLLCWSQGSRKGFSVPVECVYAHDRDETAMRERMLAARCPVEVLLQDGSMLMVERRDLESADAHTAERDKP